MRGNPLKLREEPGVDTNDIASLHRITTRLLLVLLVFLFPFMSPDKALHPYSVLLPRPAT